MAVRREHENFLVLRISLLCIIKIMHAGVNVCDPGERLARVFALDACIKMLLAKITPTALRHRVRWRRFIAHIPAAVIRAKLHNALSLCRVACERPKVNPIR
jgi:hypothetical protein